MKNATLIFILLFSVQSFGQTDLAQLAGQMDAVKSETSVLDQADTMLSFYNRNEPEFARSTYVSFMCAEKEGQMERLADQLVNSSAVYELDRLISNIIIKNEKLQKNKYQIAVELRAEAEKVIQRFFQIRIQKMDVSTNLVDCYLSRVR